MHVSKINQKEYLTELFTAIKGRDALYSDFAADVAGDNHRNYSTEYPAPILLRHDVDDKLELSIKMAYLQHQCGVSATYFILDTAPYWQPESKQFWNNLHLIKDLGHEIAWHNNALSRHVSTKRPLPDLISEPLRLFADNGFTIWGSASHGDQLCYQYGFINYEIFTECQREHDLSFPDKKIAHTTHRMAEFGLNYEAYFLPRDQYFSESGGTWREMPTPEKLADTNKITHILIHPQWWTRL